MFLSQESRKICKILLDALSGRLPYRYWQKSNQGSMLQKPQDFRLVRQALVDADLFNLGHQDLEESHDSLQGQLGLPTLDPLLGGDPSLIVSPIKLGT